MASFDTIIIGAGSAGCVLANKLGADRTRSILVIEAGPVDRSLYIHIPAGVYRAWKDPKYNWDYTAAPQNNLHKTNIEIPRGRVLGGSSSINSMVYMRGHPLDYDAWATDHNLPDWSYANCLSYFKAGETSDRGGDEYRGDNGPLGVSKGQYDNPLFDAFIASGEQAGQGRTDDPNGFNPEGVCRLDATRRNGRRCSAAVAHLRPALKRGNVTLLTNAQVTRILMSGTQTTGIEFIQNGETQQAHASDIILSGGAINSPHLLMLSGIGPKDHLTDKGIETRVHSPGVGQNLMDHANLILQFESLKSFPIHRVDHPIRKGLAGAYWLFTRKGVAASNIWEAGGLIKSDDTADYPDIQYHFGPVGFEYTGNKITLNQAFAIHVDVLRPKSRGVISLSTSNPLDKPLLNFNFLDKNHDMDILIKAVHKTRDLVSQPAFRGLAGRELFESADAKTDADIITWIRHHLETDFHPCGTCKMGNDDMAVTDDQGRVHGTTGLRVVDASLFPMIPSGNLNAPTQMLAAKIADKITGAAPLAPIHAKFAFQ
ncbi:choline dehydrogenase [Amylibacter sp. IMCC11727]|uniref:GMC family oxidoreductase n=1 Tax=Amylibacter sp. IMCC11727 TaxID=3039851 RepID=UPI00244DA8FD|nr:choline dehydrogenase [Amylibacter sp. IMCC11727]WGI20579.1 choline dehydrogenase [Amylibacter sp. IMCC11727]